MISTDFGIIDDFHPRKDYTDYTPERYHCVAIDDDAYLNDWWDLLSCMDSYNVYDKGVLQPQKALSRWGITIIPPRSLPLFLDIVVLDRRYEKDERLIALAKMIRQAIGEQKHMIHYGV